LAGRFVVIGGRGRGSERLHRRAGSPTLRAALAVAALTTAGLVASTSPAGAVSTGTTPNFVQTIGGPLHAEVYPSGLEMASDGNLIVADTGNDAIRKYSAVDGHQIWAVGTQGTGVGQFSEPRDVAVDATGHIYVADTMNKRIVVLQSDGTGWTSFSGPSSNPMGTPMGLSISGGKIYVADAGQNVIRVFDLAGTQTLKIVSVGACSLTGIRDADADAAGNIYGAGYTTNKIVKFNPAGTLCMKAWGTKGSGDGQFKAPYGVRVAYDPVMNVQRVYVADSNNERVQVFKLTGGYVNKVGLPGEPDQPGTLTQLRRVAVAADGDIWTADLWGWRLERFDRTPTGWTYGNQTIGTPLPAPTSTHVFHEVRGIDVNGDVIAADDTVHHREVLMSASTGALQSTCGDRGSTLGEFNWPRGVAWDESTGELWVADTKQYRIQVINPSTCEAVDVFGSKGAGFEQFNWVYAVAIRQSDGIAVIADGKNNRIKIYDVASHQPLAVYGTKGGGPGRFREPQGIAVDPVTDHVYVADTGNNRIAELSVSGSGAVTWVRSIAGGFLGPTGVAADADGRIYVADTMNDRVAVVSKTTGLVTGTFDGPDGLDQPAAIAVDDAGDVYVSDTYNDRIQKFSWAPPPPPPTISIGDATVTEGDSGTTAASFAVTLSHASSSTVTVDWTTSDGTATAPPDYEGASDTVTFTPGQTSATIDVNVVGDTDIEPDETFSVDLSAPTNATISDGSGVGTITNDDLALLPTISIGNSSGLEGNAGTRSANFPVALSSSSAVPVTVAWATADGTAIAPADYSAANGTLAFDPGETAKAIGVVVNGDAVTEPSESFAVTLSSPSNATIGDGSATGTISNDDSAGKVAVDLAVGAAVHRSAVRVRGTVTPAIPGAEVKIRLIRIVDGRRTLVTHRMLPVTAADGDPFASYSGRFERPRDGTYRFRVVFAGDDMHRGARTTTRFQVG
jgi:DNA-binding beta-propeller fold protein YncE